MPHSGKLRRYIRHSVPIWIPAFAGMTITLTTVAALASSDHAGGEMQGGALFKNGQGLSLSEIMKESINLQTAEAIEESITPVFFAELQSTTKGRELSGWVSEGEAANIRKGDTATLDSSGKTFKGEVMQVSKSAYAAGGDYEVIVQAEEEITPGTPVRATFAAPANASVLVVPSSALLVTAEGEFVYAKSGDFYVRTPVKTGSMSADKIEILDGLYSGDEVVTTPVMQLWLAELQAIRGGQSCADGH